MITTSSLKAIPCPSTTPATKKPSSNCSLLTSTLPANMTGHPRFTSEEKKILYSLFRQHEDVIDIKNRKNQRGKYSIRDAWQSIVDGFNRHPNAAIHRNHKQIQKFWLNARLRKQYPSKSTKDTKPKAKSNNSSTPKPSDTTVPSPIKRELEYSLPIGQSPETTENSSQYEEIDLKRISISDPRTLDPLEDSEEAITEVITHQKNREQENAQLQLHENTTTQAQQQINFDNISAEKLSLNDLLQFKNARPHDEIIIQIKHPDGRSITLPSPNRINIPHQQITYNQIEVIGETKAQPQIEVQHYQASPQIIPSNFQQQYNTYTTQNLSHSTTPSNMGQASQSENATRIIIAESFEDKINVFKLKETELRRKEIKLQSEQKRIELSQMEEELRHQKEMHRLQVEEIQIKIRILCEEEKQLRNKKK